jgi:hypothetical protein
MISNTAGLCINANVNLTANNNIEEKPFFSAKIWRHIVSFCGISTALSINRSCKYIHFVTKEDLQKKIEMALYCKRVPDNCDAYSIKNYKEFIAPILENLDAKTKNIIDLHLDNLKKSKITSTIENTFSAFLFNSLAHTAKNIPTATSVINELELNQVTEHIMNFANNCYVARFSHSQNKIHIYQFNFQANIDLLEIISPTVVNEYIIKMQFTNKNNLLVLIRNNIENKLKLALFELNLGNTSDISKVNQLWSYTTNNFGILHFAKAVIFPNSNDSKIILIKHDSKENQETFLLTINDSNYKIHKYNFYDIKQTPFSQIHEIIFCNNGLDLALITEDRSYNKELYLLARNNNTERFIEQQLPIFDTSDLLYRYYKDLQFNKSGSICIYISQGYKIVLLNKIAGKWYFSMHLQDSYYYGLSLTLDEKNIFIIRAYKDFKNNDCKQQLEVMPIEDKILTSVPTPFYTRKYIIKGTTIGYKNFHHLVKKDINRITEFTIHPSGLAVFACDNLAAFNYNIERNTKIKIIYPKQFTKFDTVNHLGSKLAYYTKKVFYD